MKFYFISNKLCLKQFLDIQFFAFMKYLTNLNGTEIHIVFEKLDIDRSGTLEFEEFYFLVCVLIAVKVKILIKFRFLIFEKFIYLERIKKKKNLSLGIQELFLIY